MPTKIFTQLNHLLSVVGVELEWPLSNEEHAEMKLPARSFTQLSWLFNDIDAMDEV